MNRTSLARLPWCFPQAPDGYLWETPADGWPSFEVPSEVPRDSPATPPEPTETPPAQAPAPTGDVRQTAPPPAPPAGQPAQPRQDLPDYRQRQIQEREQREHFNAAVNAAVQTQLRTMLGPALGLTDQPQQATLTPRQQAARTALLELMPELKDLLPLAPRAKDVLGATDSASRFSRDEDARWKVVANRTLDTVYTGVAKALLGSDKTVQDLDDELKDDLLTQFAQWIERDQSGTRVYRYEAQDPALVTEFLQRFTAKYLDPVRRAAAVRVTTRGTQAARQPIQGPGTPPPPAQPPKVDLQNEDETHGRAWAVLQQLRGAG
jgi:hypothetical protein